MSTTSAVAGFSPVAIGGTSATLSTSQTAQSWYYCNVTCAGNTTASGVKQVNMGYCVPTYTNAGDYISNFSTTGGATNITNASGAASPGNYGDFTAMAVSASASTSFNFSTTYVGGANGVRIWVDWNQNLIFETGESVFYLANSNATKTGTITVPGGTPQGNYRMRVRAQYGSTVDPTACGVLAYGEAEDYTVSVLAPPSCLAPSALTASATATGGILGWTANGTATVWDLEIGPSGFTPTGTPTVNDVAANPYTWTGGTANTNYQFYVRSDCGMDNTNTSTWTGPFAFYTGYCTPAPSSVDGSGITNVSFSTVNNTTGAETGNYGDYTAMIGNIAQSTTVTVNITYTTGFTYGTKIWVDWNNDLDFNDVGEEVYSGESLATSPTTLVATFAVGTNSLGQHRMRIGGADSGTLIPCYTGTYGSYEDYTVNVTAPPACIAPTALTATGITATSANLGWTANGTGTAWDIEIGVTGFVPTGTPSFNDVTSNPYAWTGGAATTTYQFYVRTDCGMDNTATSAWAGPFSFTTPCATIVPTFPYTVPFTTAAAPNTPPTCWSNPLASGGEQWRIATTTPLTGNYPPSVADHTSGTGALAWLDGSADILPNQLITPLIDISALPSATVGFWFLSNNTTNTVLHTIKMDVWNGTAWVNMITYAGNSASWVELSGIVPGGIPSVTNFRIVGVADPLGTSSGNYFYNDLFVDDFFIKATPTCPAPNALTATSVTSTGAALGWTETGSATAWDLEIGINGFVPSGTPTANDVGANPYTWAGGTANTTYQFYVRADCGMDNVDVSTWTGPFSFTTPCAAFSVPFQEGFNSASTTQSCWTVLNVNNDVDLWNMDYTGYASEGDQSAGMYTDFNSGANDDYLISPAITLTGTERLRFKYRVRSSGEPNDFEVLLSTSGAAPANFTNVLMPLTSFSNTTYAEQIISLAAYTGTARIAFHVPPGGLDGYYLYIDDVNVEVIPSCLVPTAVAVSAITQTSASVAWTCTSCTGDYIVEYGATGFTPGTGATAGVGGTIWTGSPVAGSPVTLTGLTSATGYSVVVREHCSGLDYSVNSAITNFFTACGTFSVPFQEGFNSASTTQNCWTVLNVNGDADLWNMDYTGYASEGDQSAGMYTDFNSGANDDWLISPAITLTGTERLRFKYRVRSSGEPNDFEVLLSTSGATPASFTNVLMPLTSFSNTTYAEQIISLAAYTGTAQIAFHVPSGGLDGYYLYIDDVNVETIPTCLVPTAVAVSAITQTSASVAWTCTSCVGNYIVEYGTTGFTPGTGATAGVGGTIWTGSPVAGSPVTITGLSASTGYSVYVREHCSGVNYSFNSSVANFATLCGTVNVPYTLDFESAIVPAFPACVATQTVGSSNAWTVASAPNASFPSKTARYSYNYYYDADAWFFTVGINLTAGTSYTVRYRYGTTGYDERLEVKYGTTATAAGMSTLVFDHGTFQTTGGTATKTASFTVPTTGVYYLGWHCYSLYDQNSLYVDDILVDVSPALDMGATALATPAPGCYGAAETVSVTVTNHGSQPINFATNPVTVTTNVTGITTATLSATVNTGTLAPGGTQNVAMSTTLDMSAVGTYTFNANTTVTGDGEPSNNAMAAAMRAVTATVAVPYTQDFSANTSIPTGWSATGWSVSSTHGRTNNGLYKEMWSFTPSGQFNLPKLGPIGGAMTLKYDYRLVNYSSYPATALPNSPAWGTIDVQISTDCGGTYTTIQSINPASHTSTTGWATKNIPLAAYAAGTIQVRFVSTWTAGDWYADFDNFAVIVPPALDMGATALVAPASAGCFGSSEPVSVTIQNLGSATIDYATTPVTVSAAVSGTATNSFSVVLNTGTLAAGATQNVAMGTQDMSVVGAYTFTASTSVTGDADAGNDAMAPASRTTSAPATALPYTEDFTAGVTPAGWNTTGWTTGTNTHGNPSNGLYKNMWSSGISGQFTMVKLGQVAASTLLTFDYRLVNYTSYPATALPNSPAWGTINVQVSTDCGGTFNTFQSITPANHIASTAWANKAYSLAAYAGQDVIIRFNTAWTTGDYYVDFDNFNIGTGCTGSPDAGVSSTATPGVCDGTAVTMTNDGTTTGLGISRQWRSSPTANGTYVPVTGGTGATTSSYTTDPLAIGSYYYRLYTSCASGSTVYSNTVILTSSAEPTVTVTANGPTSFCAGGSVTLTSSTGNSYLWAPNSETTSAITVSTAGSYSVSTTVNGCAGTSAPVVVSINPSPTGVTANSSSLLECPGGVIDLTATGSTNFTQTVLNEGFNGVNPPAGWVIAGGMAAVDEWTLQPDGYTYDAELHSNDASQFIMTNNDPVGGSSSTSLTSPAINLTGYTGAVLDFYHYFNSFGGAIGAVQASTDGTNWAPVGAGYSASIGTATDWDHAQIALGTGYDNQPTVYVRFQFDAEFDLYWAVDNVSILASAPPAFSWSSAPAGFTSNVQNPTNVTVTTVPVTYTVLATAGGCSASASVTVNPAGHLAVMRINTDANASQISWEIKDAANATVASGSPVGNNQQVNQLVCLSNANGNCYTLKLTDSFGDGIIGGGWELRTTGGQTILMDSFSGGSASPANPTLTPAYGSGHPFCLPLGPATLKPTECGLFNNTLNNRIYANVMPGATQYEFQFLDPDAGYVRSIIKPSASMLFIDMGGSVNPLVPGVHYFVRIRTNAGGPLASAKYGPGCEMGMNAAAVVHCTQLINGTLYGHSCNETRAFGSPSYSFIYATPVLGASAYTFHIYIAGEPTLFDTTITRGTYVLQLKWPGTPLTNGSTYNVDVKTTVNGVQSNYCLPFCTITIDNAYTGMGGELTQVDGSFNGDVQMWPNPVADGRVNLALNGLVDNDQKIQLDLYDMYGRKVL
ncbi:MAG: choice-of-anchor J domain-containing protein, partial [Flavobacteriales bacterium]